MNTAFILLMVCLGAERHPDDDLAQNYRLNDDLFLIKLRGLIVQTKLNKGMQYERWNFIFILE